MVPKATMVKIVIAIGTIVTLWQVTRWDYDFASAQLRTKQCAHPIQTSFCLCSIETVATEGVGLEITLFCHS